MKKQLLTILAVSFSGIAFAQVGINNTTPASTLDITAKAATGATTTPEGLLIPRVDRQRAGSMTSVPTSTMIYVNDISTGSASGTAVNIDAVGFYYYNGVAWTKMGAGSAAAVTANNGLTLASGNIQLGGALTQPTLISGLTATNTLAFTGTGNNAFSVDGNTFSVDATNHSIGIGTSAPNGRFEIVGTGGADDDFYLTSNGTTSSSFAASLFLRRSAGTPAAPAIVRNGDTVGEMNFDAYNGSSYLHVAKISSVINGTPSAGSVPTDLFLSTGTLTPVERLRINSAGNVGIANNAPAATLDVAAKAATGTTTGVDGVLIPRVTRERAASMTSVPVSTLVYISEVATGAQSGATANVDAAGFYYSDGSVWQKLGGSSAAPVYQNIRGNVNTLPTSTTSYTVQPSDYTIVTTASTAVTITFPTAGFTAADAGKTVYVYNDNSAAVGNSFSGIANGVLTNNQYRGIGPFMWTGSKWIIVSK
ncbi:hypothetical protein [uncultured Chryseobacterium sp.]|uniref:hypothetical protein n=1 Tax=uncultured Chryseobacterium sp. TaxID=259322 RepID=UPI0025E38003|nr:hypothetical protein [uncultured Chryseobacterium sp.]